MTGRRFAALAVAIVAVNVFFWLATSGFALSRATGILQFIGGPIVRADVAWQSPAGVQETQIDRGVVLAVSAGSITLREADGPRTIQVAPSAAAAVRVRRGMRVIIAGPAGQPATIIEVEGIRG